LKYLIVSDIHSNWEGLQAVLDAAGREGFDQIVCCGDLVGYGADPNAVTDWARGACAHNIRGNHDKVAVGLADLEWFNEAARESAVWTGQQLTPDNRGYLYELPHGPVAVGGFWLVHGSPMDEDEYIVNAFDAMDAGDALPGPVTFFGHTHLQGGFEFVKRVADDLPWPRKEATRQEIRIDPEKRYLVNPGSVGQPRDGDPRAGWATYEPEEGLVVLRRCIYDVETAAGKIQRAGLPSSLGSRLFRGK
jgi:predicted phosphodiesterase